MKITQIKIKNFRGIEETVLDFQEFNLITGIKDTSKTNIIKALSIGISSFFLGLDAIPTINIYPEDVRRGIDEKEGVLNLMYPVEISCQCIIDEQKINWVRTIKNPGSRASHQHILEIKKISGEMQTKTRKNQPIILPIIAYYDNKRYWSLKINKSLETIKPGSRFLGYKNYFDPPLNQKQLLLWCRTMEFASRQRNQTIRIFEAVKNAITDFFDDLENINYDLSQDKLLAMYRDGKIQPLWKLDDNIRNLMAMIFDIAYRCAILNPHLQQEITRQTPGIVLIDDIELYIQPELQNKVLEKLHQIFPMIQFIVTSNSQFIGQPIPFGQTIELKSHCRINISTK